MDTRFGLLALTVLGCSDPGASPHDAVASNLCLPPIVAEGDSLTGGGDSWAWMLEEVTNVATPGDRLGPITLEQATTQVDPLYVPGATASLWGGTNDLAAFHVTSDWLLEKTALWVTGREAIGFRVAVFTMLPRDRLTPEDQATRDDFNARLASALPSSVIIVDINQPPGSTGDGVLYRADGVHLTKEGHRWILDNRIRPALEVPCDP